jgi:hypothetical protein
VPNISLHGGSHAVQKQTEWLWDTPEHCGACHFLSNFIVLDPLSTLLFFDELSVRSACLYEQYSQLKALKSDQSKEKGKGKYIPSVLESVWGTAEQGLPVVERQLCQFREAQKLGCSKCVFVTQQAGHT